MTDPVWRERIPVLERQLAEVERSMAQPDVISDHRRLAEAGRRRAELWPIVKAARDWLAAVEEAGEAEELAESDPGLREELLELAEERRRDAVRLEKELEVLMVPADPDDHRDVILEIRAAAGGDEAAIWAGDLLRMYQKFADRHGLRTEEMDSSSSGVGGYSKVSFAVKGRGSYGMLRYEGGVHRVQRVPKTESQGRVHTSTATVAVLPEADEVEVEVSPDEVRVDVFRSSGPGGQSVNTTDSAVRITHLPTGLVVSCQDQKSQFQNKEKAFRVLRARLYQLEIERRQAGIAGQRRSQVGGGDRSEKIRTYNFRDNRVTDHRIGLTLKSLDRVLEGEIDQIAGELAARDRSERLVSSLSTPPSE
ncbi:MAG: peptide chain release factor 1 [Acidimicrobiia bacterium]|nr:peptide chain release factor 1 [bacterium]MXX01269.1 peptide chain release factor 1 [Acidimicrobiia bacterium]MDE0675060.1 peptide chain release factor 1 [bacterium]MXX45150.1 peptide chain release factor 1 [Acidimicrobiia bacterium]MXY74174.1 peptide chain release factor 1 [Acidimicrobiia bacterium]